MTDYHSSPEYELHSALAEADGDAREASWTAHGDPATSPHWREISSSDVRPVRVGPVKTGMLRAWRAEATADALLASTDQERVAAQDQMRRAYTASAPGIAEAVAQARTEQQGHEAQRSSAWRQPGPDTQDAHNPDAEWAAAEEQAWRADAPKHRDEAAAIEDGGCLVDD